MIQSYILYGIILLYKPVTVTGNNTPRRGMCYTHNHDVRQGGALLYTKTSCMGTNIHRQRLYPATLSSVCMHVSAVYIYIYIYIFGIGQSYPLAP